MDTTTGQNGTDAELAQSTPYLVYPNAQRMEKGQDVKLVHD
ncbi:MAG: hypothetical protein ACYCVD_03180 [Desulfitobacteriaceae bacterium]